VQIHVTDRENLSMTEVQLTILEALRKLFPEKDIYERARPDRLSSFDKAIGSSDIRIAHQNGTSVEELIREIDQQRAHFMIQREKYLLYE
jgi:uncharacterized protein YbbC (DUF1343 family)